MQEYSAAEHMKSLKNDYFCLNSSFFMLFLKNIIDILENGRYDI